MSRPAAFVALDRGRQRGGGQRYLLAIAELVTVEGRRGTVTMASVPSPPMEGVVHDPGVASWRGALRWSVRQRGIRGATVVLNCFESALLAPLVRARRGRPVIVLHAEPACLSPRLLGALRLAARAATAAVVPAAHVVEPWARAVPCLRGRLRVIEPTAPPAGPGAPDHSGDAERLVVVARPDPVKGLDATLRAAAASSRAHAVDVFGGTEEAWMAAVDGLRDVLRDVRNRGVTVTFHGYVTEPLQTLLSRAVVVVASSSEVSPLVPLEAIASGHDLVLSRIPAHDPYLASGAALGVDANDPAGFAAVLDDALASGPAAQERRARAQALARDRYGATRFARQWHATVCIQRRRRGRLPI